MAKKKKKIKDQMGELVGVAVNVNPIIAKDGEKDKRKNYNEGEEVSTIDKRILSTIANEVKMAAEHGDDYFNSGTSKIFGTLQRELGASGKGLYAFTELRKINNQEDGKYSNEELANKLNQGYKDAGLEYTFTLPQKLRDQKQKGGEMDSQMTMMMMPEETEKSQEEMDMLPDNQMEDQHLDFIINESLDNEEEMYLMEQLQADERLSMIFDKIMDTATEFSGSGPVEGLGTEVSDSIPARLSDGEFVITAKATEEIGADNLERMMKDAEEASDNRQRVAMGGEIEKKVDRFGKPIDKDLTAEEIKRSMLSVNPRLR